MNGTMMKIGVIYTPPMANRCALDTVCPQRGFGVDAARIFCDLMRINCTFEWFESEEFGDGGENGANATGLVKAIQTGRYDTSVPVLLPTFRRNLALDFSDSYFIFDSALITRSPYPGSIYDVNWGISDGFQPSVWCCLAALFLICSFVFAYLLRRSELIVLTDHHFVSLCTRMIIALITNDHMIYHLKTVSIRTLCGTWLLAAVVVNGLYTGMLFSNKIIKEDVRPYTDVDGFVECLEIGECRIITHTTSISFFQQLTQGGSEFATRVQKALNTNPVVMAELDKIPDVILNERRYFLVWHWNKDWFYAGRNRKDACNYYLVETPFKDVEAFGVRKNSSLLPVMNKMAAVFMESALEYNLRRRYFRPPDCAQQYGSEGNEKHQHWFYSFGTILYFYGLGIALAVSSMIIEITLAWSRNLHCLL